MKKTIYFDAEGRKDDDCIQKINRLINTNKGKPCESHADCKEACMSTKVILQCTKNQCQYVVFIRLICIIIDLF